MAEFANLINKGFNCKACGHVLLNIRFMGDFGRGFEGLGVVLTLIPQAPKKRVFHDSKEPSCRELPVERAPPLGRVEEGLGDEVFRLSRIAREAEGDPIESRQFGPNDAVETFAVGQE